MRRVNVGEGIDNSRINGRHASLWGLGARSTVIGVLMDRLGAKNEPFDPGTAPLEAGAAKLSPAQSRSNDRFEAAIHDQDLDF